MFSYSNTRAEATGLGAALRVKASSESSEVAGCLIWRSVACPDSNSRVCWMSCWHNLVFLLDSWLQTKPAFFAARVKHWHQSGRWMDDVRGCACWKHGPGTSSEPPARELERKAAQTRKRGVMPSLLSLISAGNSNAHSKERSTSVCALGCANGRATGRHAYSTLTSFLIYSGHKRCHGSRDKVQSEVYDVVTDRRPRLVAPHPRETRQTPSSPITSSARMLCHRLCWSSLEISLKAT